MSGTRRGMAALADLQARQIPAYQQPLVVAPGDFRYPTFGAEPRTPPPVPAPQIPAPAGIPAPRATTSPLAGISAGRPTQQGAQTSLTLPPNDPGGLNSQDAPDPTDLGPNPAEVNTLADALQDIASFTGIARGIMSANPLGMAFAIANSPIGVGLAKGINNMLGYSPAPVATEAEVGGRVSKEDITDARTEQAAPTLGSVIGGMVGFGTRSSVRGTSKSPEEAAPVTAAPVEAAPAAAAPAVTAQDVPAPPSHMSPDEADLAGVDLGSPDAGMGGDMGNPGSGSTEGGNFGAGADGSPGGSLNSDPSSTQDTGTAGLGSQASQAESNSPGAGADGGGKGDSAGDGSNGESSAGSDAGGEKRMGGLIRSDGDGRLSAVPITAHENEFVMSPEATEMVGADLLQRINNMALEAAGHPPRPIDPQAHIVSPLSRLRAGAVPPSPGRPGASLLAQPGQQSAPIYRGPLPMPGQGGAPIPAPQAPPPLSFVSVSAPPPPGDAPPLPGAPPGPFPAPPTMPMGPGQQFAENGMEGMGQPMIPPPPAPPGARAPNRAGPAGGGGGLTTEQLNGMSLDLARGTGTPPAGGPAREAYDRIAGRMRGDTPRPAFRMGGLVSGVPGGEEPVEAGPWEWDGSDGEQDQAASVLPRSSRPYAEEGMQDQPFGDDPSAPAGGPTMDDVKQRLLALPPEMQQAVAAAIGADPMVASALLQVLGPHFAPLIQAAMTAVAPPPPDPMMALMGGGGAPMQPIG